MNELREQLMEMQAELYAHRLEVILAPAPEPRHCMHCIRVCVDRNPRWYRQLLDRHPSFRRRCRPDSRVKRACVVRVLEQLIAGRPCRSRLAPELLSIARKRMGSTMVA